MFTVLEKGKMSRIAERVCNVGDAEKNHGTNRQNEGDYRKQNKESTNQR